MSLIESAIREEADNQVRRLYDATPTLNEQLRQLQMQQAQIERQVADVKAQLEAARVAQKRLLHFQPCIGMDFQCPRCWIVKENRSALRPIPSSTSDDMMRCSGCGLDLIIAGHGRKP